jgi:hypothetical protein
MNEITKKLKENLIDPAANGRSASTLLGTIISVNEKTNSCSVSFVRQDGKKNNKDNVPVMLTNKSIIDWFPEEGETVLLQEKNTVIYITGPSYSNYGDIKKSITLKNDIFSESFLDVLGGFLF